MNNHHFNPKADLPKCDICNATMTDMTTVFITKTTGGALEYIVTFACEAKWSATRNLDFNRSSDTVPDGNFTVWKDGSSPKFLEIVPCKNAARIARKLRDDAKVTVKGTWRDSRPEDEQAYIDHYADPKEDNYDAP